MSTAEAPPISPAIWEESPRGGFPDPRFLGLSGLEQIRAFLDRKVPPPPIHHLTGMIPTAGEPGSATFEMPATPWLLAPIEFLSLGVLAMLADGSLGCAIQTELPPATPYTTSDLTLNFLRPVDADGGILRAPARVIHAGRSLGVADTLITDHHGRPVAHGTTRCFILPAIDPAPEPPAEVDVYEVPPTDTPDPYLRPVAGEPLRQEVWDRMNGLEIMRGLIDGTLPPPPLSHLTGLRVLGAEEGACSFSLPSSLWLCSPSGFVEGGAIAMLADSALASAVQTTCPPRSAYTPLDLKVNFVRPVLPDGRDLIARARVTHRGKTMAVAAVELENADGKRVAVGTGTALVRQDHPWRPEEPAAPGED
jgi:uncharacterized protein (TIGR00369 family)